MNKISENLSRVLNRISLAEHKYERVPYRVQLIAVSKTRSATAIAEAYHAGQHQFGENYLQEAIEKIQVLHDLSIIWHFIGPIQSNKTKKISENFHWAHSIDRYKIAEQLSKYRPTTIPPLQICLQVKLSQETTKSGIQPNDLPELLQQIASLPNILVRGLMTIPTPSNDFNEQRKPFHELSQILYQLNQQGHKLDTLSMGMSNDLEAAIAEGATMVRIGTAIFGPRTLS